jgi:hypothetical protein
MNTKKHDSFGRSSPRMILNMKQGLLRECETENGEVKSQLVIF